MADDTDTPVEVPQVRLVRAGSAGNGVPEHVEFETTEQVVEAVMAGGVSADLMASFAEKAIASFVANGGGSGDGDGGHARKAAKKQNYIAIVLMLISGATGGVGGYYALKAQAASNTHEVEHLKKMEPRVNKNSDDIRFIKVDVSGINKSVGEIKTQQSTIVQGIGDLKEENVNRLEKENAKLEREIRRLERNR